VVKEIELRLPMIAQFDPQDWRERRVREWLLLLLRFAFTHEPSDQLGVLAMADELDSLGMQWRPGGLSFFQRTSQEVCRAILAASDGHIDPVLRKHIARIDDPRLRRAFRAAVGIESAFQSASSSEKRRRRKTRDLWKGLPSR
jgi:hypothetical protein